MTIASEITRIKTNIENAYAKAEEKGATIPEVKNSENLASCVETITTGGGSGGGYTEVARYQVVDGNAILSTRDITGAFDDIVKVEDDYCFYYAFRRSSNITGQLSFPKLTHINGMSAFEYAFHQCSKLTGEASFPKLTTITGSGALKYAFYYCSKLTGVDLSSLETIDDSGLNYCFQGCSNITYVKLDSLKTINSSSLSSAFSGCSKLTTISFPSLTTINSGGGLSNAFSSCTALTEIHFRSDMQSVVEGVSGYSSKFGATNATIYFDL